MTTQTSAPTLISFSVEERQNFSPVGLRALFRMEPVFHLTDVEISRILGGASRSDVKEWKRAALAKEAVTLPNETLNRLRSALVIFNQLGRKFPKALDKAEDWLRKPHAAPMFGGRSPLALMMDVEIRYLIAVARYAEHNALVLDSRLTFPKAPARRAKN